MKNRQHGFTLLELLVVIAVVAVLASLGVSGYRSHLQTANRQAAVATLQLAQQSMERAFLRNNTYINALSPAQFSAIASTLPASHVFSVKTATASTYVLSATPTDDALCGDLTIDQSGLKTISGTAANIRDCWGQ